VPDNLEATARQEYDELRQAVLDDWIVITTRTAGRVDEMKRTLSWRITAPLRLARVFQLTAREEGLSVARDLTAAAIARRFGRD
jgi:hypothetical protein